MEFPASDPLSAQPEPKLNQLFLPHSITLQPLTLTLDKFRIQPRRNNTMKTQNLLLKLLIVPAMVVVLAGSAQAATKTWAPGTTDFNLTSNWTGGLPNSADVATFTGAAGTQPNLTGNITTQSLFFSTTASSGYSLTRTAGSLTLIGTGNGTSFVNASNTSGTNTINVPIIIGYAAGQTARINQSASGTLELLGDISSTNAITGLNITIASGGALTLSGNNTYQGTTRMTASNGLLNINSTTAISSGALVIEAATTIDNKSAGAITLANNNAINLSAAAAGNLTFVGTRDLSFGSGIVTMSVLDRTITTTAGKLTIGAINESGGSRSFIKAGSGTLAITGATGGNYSGTTTLSAGILEVSRLANGGTSSSIGASSNAATNLLLANGVTLRYVGAGNSTDRLFTLNSTSNGQGATLDASGSGAVNFTNTGTLAYGTAGNTRTLTLTGTNMDENTLAANLQNNGAGATSLVKEGIGRWTLTGSSTYGGTTSVNVGTLLINGNQAGAVGNVSVAGNATLGGSGTIGGATAIANFGILAPGTIADSTSTLSFNNQNLLFSGNNTVLNLDIVGTGLGNFDKLDAINLFTMNGDITFTLTGSYGTASWDVADFSSRSGNFDTVTLAGNYSGNLSRNDNTWTGNVGGQAWTFEQTTGLLSVVPEPSTWVLLAFGLTFIVVMRRRRA